MWHYGTKTIQQWQCDAVGNVLQGNLEAYHSCGCHFDTCHPTYIVADQVHPFMAFSSRIIHIATLQTRKVLILPEIPDFLWHLATTLIHYDLHLYNWANKNELRDLLRGQLVGFGF